MANKASNINMEWLQKRYEKKTATKSSNTLSEKSEKIIEKCPKTLSGQIEWFKKEFSTKSILNKESYTLDEMCEEYEKIISLLTFGIPILKFKNFKDVIQYFDFYENKDFKKTLIKIQNDCSNYKHGIFGEEQTYNAISLLDDEIRILRNVRFKADRLDCEIDLVLIAPQGIYLVEVKYLSRNATILESGMLETDSDAKHKNRYKKNVAEQAQRHSSCIRRLLKSLNLSNIPIYSVIVFANDKSKITNNYKHIEACYRNELEHIVRRDMTTQIITTEDMANIEKTLCENSLPPKSYTPDIKKVYPDFNDFINEYCSAIIKIDKKKRKKEREAKENEEMIFMENDEEIEVEEGNGSTLGYLGGVLLGILESL